MTAKPYYVYQLIDPRDGKPFYIGKGTKQRAWAHLRGKSHSEAVSLRVADIRGDDLEPAVEIVGRFATDAEAVEREAELICAATGLLNVLTKGWALTPERQREKDAADKEKEWAQSLRDIEDIERRITPIPSHNRDEFIKELAALKTWVVSKGAVKHSGFVGSYIC